MFIKNKIRTKVRKDGDGPKRENVREENLGAERGAARRMAARRTSNDGGVDRTVTEQCCADLLLVVCWRGGSDSVLQRRRRPEVRRAAEDTAWVESCRRRADLRGGLAGCG